MTTQIHWFHCCQTDKKLIFFCYFSRDWRQFFPMAEIHSKSAFNPTSSSSFTVTTQRRWSIFSFLIVRYGVLVTKILTKYVLEVVQVSWAHSVSLLLVNYALASGIQNVAVDDGWWVSHTHKIQSHVCLHLYSFMGVVALHLCLISVVHLWL